MAEWLTSTKGNHHNMILCSNRSTKFDVLSAWTQNGVDKIDIRKSIIPRIERAMIVSQNLCFFLKHYTTLARFSRSSTIAVEAAVRCCALLCAEKTSSPCKISTKHEQQSRFKFCERGKCAMHGRSMEGSRRLIHAAVEALRLPSKQHVQRWLHSQRGLPPKLSLLVRCTTQTY